MLNSSRFAFALLWPICSCLFVACGPTGTGSGNPSHRASLVPTDQVVQEMRHYAKVICQICDTLRRVPDELASDQASEQIRSLLPDLAAGMRNEIAAKLAGADWQQVQQQLSGQRGFEDAELSNAMGDALKGPAAEELRPVLEEIMQIAIDTVPGEQTKQQLREHFRSLGL